MCAKDAGAQPQEPPVPHSAAVALRASPVRSPAKKGLPFSRGFGALSGHRLRKVLRFPFLELVRSSEAVRSPVGKGKRGSDSHSSPSAPSAPGQCTAHDGQSSAPFSCPVAGRKKGLGFPFRACPVAGPLSHSRGFPRNLAGSPAVKGARIPIRAQCARSVRAPRTMVRAPRSSCGRSDSPSLALVADVRSALGCRADRFPWNASPFVPGSAMGRHTARTSR